MSGRGGSVTQRAIEVIQGITLRENSNADRLLTELRAIVGIVMRHGSEEIRRDYLRKGNIHGDWNTLRLSLTERQHITIEVDREPVEVEFAQWWTPEPVALAHLMPGGRPGHGRVSRHDPFTTTRRPQNAGASPTQPTDPGGASAGVPGILRFSDCAGRRSWIGRRPSHPGQSHLN